MAWLHSLIDRSDQIITSGPHGDLPRWRKALENLRLRTSRPDALIQLAALSVIAGLITGTVIASFRFLIEAAQPPFYRMAIQKIMKACRSACDF